MKISISIQKLSPSHLVFKTQALLVLLMFLAAPISKASKGDESYSCPIVFGTNIENLAKDNNPLVIQLLPLKNILRSMFGNKYDLNRVLISKRVVGEETTLIRLSANQPVAKDKITDDIHLIRALIRIANKEFLSGLAKPLILFLKLDENADKHDAFSQLNLIQVKALEEHTIESIAIFLHEYMHSVFNALLADKIPEYKEFSKRVNEFYVKQREVKKVFKWYNRKRFLDLENPRIDELVNYLENEIVSLITNGSIDLKMSTEDSMMDSFKSSEFIQKKTSSRLHINRLKLLVTIINEGLSTIKTMDANSYIMDPLFLDWSKMDLKSVQLTLQKIKKIQENLNHELKTLSENLDRAKKVGIDENTKLSAEDLVIPERLNQINYLYLNGVHELVADTLVVLMTALPEIFKKELNSLSRDFFIKIPLPKGLSDLRAIDEHKYRELFDGHGFFAPLRSILWVDYFSKVNNKLWPEMFKSILATLVDDLVNFKTPPTASGREGIELADESAMNDLDLKIYKGFKSLDETHKFYYDSNIHLEEKLRAVLNPFLGK